jgi:hypothetical protein
MLAVGDIVTYTLNGKERHGIVKALAGKMVLVYCLNDGQHYRLPSAELKEKR